MSALDRIKSWCKQGLFSVWLKLDMLVFRKALALSRLCLMLLDAEIRRLDESLLQFGELEDHDHVVGYVARGLTNREQLAATQSAAANMSHLAVSLSEKSRADARVRDAVGTYFLSQAYVYKEAHQAEKQQQASRAAEEFLPSAPPLMPKDIYKKYAEIDRRHKELRASLAERSAIKFEIRAAHIISTMTIIPAVMFVAGLWYVTTLLAEFGLRASHYYTIGDYVASSLTQLSSAAVSVAVSLLTIWFGLRHGSLRPRIVHEELLRKEKGPLLLVLLAATITITVTLRAYDGEFDRSGFTMLGTIAAYPLSEKFAEAFSKNVRQVQVGITALLVFATLTFAASYSEIDDLRHDRWGTRINTALRLKADSVLRADGLVIIAANSNYIFALDKRTKAAHAISRDQIAAISIAPK